MGSNKSLAYRRVDISLPPPLVSWGRLSSLARETIPSFFPSLPRPPTLSPLYPTHFTHLQPNGLQKWESQVQPSQQHPPCRSQAPSLKPLIFPGGVVSGHQSTVWHPVRPNSIFMEPTTTDRAPVTVGLSEENSHWKKRQRQKHVHHWQKLTRAQSIPGKIWMPTNQIRAISPRSRVSREPLARALKGSQGI